MSSSAAASALLLTACAFAAGVLTAAECSVSGPNHDCGYPGIARETCQSKGCCWSPPAAAPGIQPGEAWCFHPNANASEYELVTTKDTDAGWEGVLRNLTSTQPELGSDVTSLTIQANKSLPDIVHISITDLHDTRWRIPESLFPSVNRQRGSGLHSPEAAEYDLKYNSTPFSFSIARANDATSAALFSTTGQRLIFKDQYIELSTSIDANSSLFGAQERTASKGLTLQRAGRPMAMWNHDTLSANPDTNLYGSHPFVLEVRPDGSSHGVLLLNSNAMEVAITNDTLSWRLTGGMIDLYILMGPTPAAVLEQLTRIIGRPALPPLWSLGFHQCKWGYNNVEDLGEVVAKYKAADIPLEVMWTDIDYMDGYRDFSLDPNRFSKDKMQAFVKQLHVNKQYWVPIVDPGIKVDPGYPAYDQGLAAHAFITDVTGQPFLGQVWPGATHFLDFLSKQGVKYWEQQLQAFHELAPYDGLWIDMDEVSNFCTGDICHMSQGVEPNASAWLHSSTQTGTSNDCQLICDTEADLAKLTPQQRLYRDPPYRINNAGGQLLGHRTIGTTATHADASLQYNTHNLYGLSEAVATHSALEKITGKRPFILTRSSFLGTGAVAAHWTGDNAATWADLQWSISSTLGMGLVGLPFVGADICGFSGDTTEELCGRWISAGAFYPFSRNHNTLGAAPQELYLWESVADAGRRAIKMRYQLLPHLYTAFHQANQQGTPVAKPLWFAFPQDPATHTIDDQWLLGNILISPVLHQGETKREAHFPKGKWYNLFDNTTIDAHDGGKSVMLDLPMGHVGVHMMAGTILPMQQPAPVTADVRASPLTLAIALPPMKPLLHFAHEAQPTHKAEAGRPRSALWTIAVDQQQNQSESSQGMAVQSTSRKMMAGMQAELRMTAGMQTPAAAETRQCGVSEPGRVTACGQVFMDNGERAQAPGYASSLLELHTEILQDAATGLWEGKLVASLSVQKGEQGAEGCAAHWPDLDTVVLKGLLKAQNLQAQSEHDGMWYAVPDNQVTANQQQNQVTISGLQHQMQCGKTALWSWSFVGSAGQR